MPSDAPVGPTTKPSDSTATKPSDSGWARSNKAQVVQAFLTSLQVLVSLGALTIAVYAYVFTIIPAQQLVEAKESLASVNFQLKNAQRDLTQYQDSRRALIIDDFVRQVLTRTASIPTISATPPPPGRHYGSERTRPGIYFDAFKTMFGDEWQKEFWIESTEGQLTGKEVIAKVLAGPLLYPLPASEREIFKNRVKEIIEKSKDKEAFTSKLAIPPPDRADNIDAYNEEEKRRLDTHKRFVAAMIDLRNELRKSYDLTT
jgi:hypothetical protein